jgi:hypothetical protein
MFQGVVVVVVLVLVLALALAVGLELALVLGPVLVAVWPASEVNPAVLEMPLVYTPVFALGGP